MPLAHLEIDPFEMVDADGVDRHTRRQLGSALLRRSRKMGELQRGGGWRMGLKEPNCSFVDSAL